ncbi:MAG: nicotinate (nicotinamide) nucleotide adenylyltransferase [bacterium]|nr:nicotinate (nicotinamide) nucleotide adenylyltransferase [bacterium]
MAKFVLEKYDFDKIIFIPSYIPPHKNIDKELALHRINMVKLATQHNHKFEVSDIEYKNEGKSYSILTVNKIREMYKIPGRLNFLIGTDAFSNLDSWYNTDELKKTIHFIVFPRKEDNEKQIDYDSYKLNGWNFEILQTDFINVSSTEIRGNKGEKSVCAEVEEYIEKYGLYKN